MPYSSLANCRFQPLSHFSMMMGVAGLEPAQTEVSWFTVRCNCRYATLPFYNFRWKNQTSIPGFKDRCPAIKRNGIVLMPPARIELAMPGSSDLRSAIWATRAYDFRWENRTPIACARNRCPAFRRSGMVTDTRLELVLHPWKGCVLYLLDESAIVIAHIRHNFQLRIIIWSMVTSSICARITILSMEGIVSHASIWTLPVEY